MSIGGKLISWIRAILNRVRSWFRKSPQQPAEVTNSQVNHTLVNHVRDSFHKPTSSFKPQNNRRRTAGRVFYYLSGKKFFK